MPEERLHLRRHRAVAIFGELETWLHAQFHKIPGKSELAKATRYALTRLPRLPRLRPHLEQRRLEIDNNCSERSMKPMAPGRKNHLFVGSGGAGKSAAIAYRLIETAKLNRVDPQAWLADILGRIADHKITRINDLLLWRYAAAAA